MRRFPSAALLSLVLLTSACSGQPLPADKAEYAGHWQGGGITLAISRDGGVSYMKVDGSSTVKINGPVRSWSGDDFEVGIPLVNTTFDVSAPPHEVDGAWKMTVDGVELMRVAQ